MVAPNNIPAFCLKLNSHKTHVIDAFQKLYNDELMVDCTLSCSDGSLKAHKLVLSACSPYFTNLFTTHTNPNQYPIIILKDLPFQDLKLIIEFMYRGEITVPQNVLPSILESAKSLMITGLREIKIANIETNKSGESVSKSARRSRKRRHKTTNSMDSTAESDRSDVEISENESPDKISRPDYLSKQSQEQSEVTTSGGGEPASMESNTAGNLSESHDSHGIFDLSDDQQQTIEADPASILSTSTDQMISETSITTATTTTTTSSSMITSNAGGSGIERSNAIGSKGNAGSTGSSNQNVSRTPITLKNTLKQLRIEKASSAIHSSGRKMWSEDETRVLIRIWEEEVWASAGKKALSLKRISDLLLEENIDRDISQVEGKMKALKRDFKAVKLDKALPAIQNKMAPYLDKLELIISREESI